MNNSMRLLISCIATLNLLVTATSAVGANCNFSKDVVSRERAYLAEVASEAFDLDVCTICPSSRGDSDDVAFDCDESDRITSITLTNGKLESFDLSKFSNIQNLTLRSNSLTSLNLGSVLRSLRKLDLENNSLLVFEANRLPNLAHLLLQNNNLTSFKMNNKLPKLLKLNLSGNALSSVNINKKLGNLTDLSLDDNKLTSLTIERKLESLQTLNLDGNRLTSLTIKRELESLQTLHVRRNNLKSLPDFEKLPSLEDLYIEGNSDYELCRSITKNWKRMENVPGINGFLRTCGGCPAKPNIDIVDYATDVLSLRRTYAFEDHDGHEHLGVGTSITYEARDGWLFNQSRNYMGNARVEIGILRLNCKGKDWGTAAWENVLDAKPVRRKCARDNIADQSNASLEYQSLNRWTCPPGHEGDGNMRTKCSLSNDDYGGVIWKPPQPACNPMKCIASDKQLKAMDEAAMAFGSTVQYFCPHGKLVGGETSRNITCSLGRDNTTVHWNPKVPSCTDNVEYCGELAIDSTRGRVDVSSRALGGKALTECANGFALSTVDAREVECVKHNRTSGYWEPSPPKCQPKKCPTHDLLNENASRTFGSPATWTCPPGKHIDGEPAVISMPTECSVEDGGSMYWLPQAPNCVDLLCDEFEHLRLPEKAEPKELTMGFAREVRCGENQYVKYRSRDYRTLSVQCALSEDRTKVDWNVNKDDIKCEDVKCGRIEAFGRDPSIQREHFPVGHTISLMCANKDSHPRNRSDAETRCVADGVKGKWSRTAVECVDKTCAHLPLFYQIKNAPEVHEKLTVGRKVMLECDNGLHLAQVLHDGSRHMVEGNDVAIYCTAKINGHHAWSNVKYECVAASNTSSTDEGASKHGQPANQSLVEAHLLWIIVGAAGFLCLSGIVASLCYACSRSRRNKQPPRVEDFTAIYARRASRRPSVEASNMSTLACSRRSSRGSATSRVCAPMGRAMTRTTTLTSIDERMLGDDAVQSGINGDEVVIAM